jgi:hypothetical protein
MTKIGITERGDAALDLSWKKWVQEDKKPAVLITKDPRTLFLHLEGRDNVIVHCTITGNGGTVLEPNVRPYTSALTGLHLIEGLLGIERVVLRIDPIIPYGKYLGRAASVAETAAIAYQKDLRTRISFMDNYNHVKERWANAALAPLPYDFHACIIDRMNAELRIRNALKPLPQPEVCGEPGFKCTGCISKLDCEILGVEPSKGTSQQRKACACLSLKHELLKSKGRCAHQCLYCYWK